MDHDIDPYLDGPGKDAQIRIFENGRDRAATMRWGFKPVEPGGRPVSLLRCENWEVQRPCLVPANEFALKQEEQGPLTCGSCGPMLSLSP